MAQLDNIIAPELKAHRLGHAERVDVDDATTYGELGNILHHRHPFKSNGFEVRRERFQATYITLAQFQSSAGQSARQRRLFEHRPRGGEQHPDATSAEQFQRFNTLTGDFRMRLHFAEAFAGRVQRHGDVIHQRLQIG